MTQTTKDAEELVKAFCLPTEDKVWLAVAQSALTAAEQHGFERGKADVVRPRYSGQPVLEAFDDTCVDKLTFDMKVKMDYSREVKGRSGWFDKKQCTVEQLSSMLRNHVEKGDPVDVANFCMMLHHRGERISTVTQADVVPSGDAEEKIRQLEKLVYVPGLWKCAKCSCTLVSTNLHADDGSFSSNNSPQNCPNNCGPMWRVTERQAGNDLLDRMSAARAEGERNAIPDGWQLVPKEPTEEMLFAGDAVRGMADWIYKLRVQKYRDMLAAAPPAPLTERAQQWQPIETAPKDGTTILVFDNFRRRLNGDYDRDGFGEVIARYTEVRGWHVSASVIDGKYLYLANPTHWMPLPAAPSPASNRSDELLQDSGPDMLTVRANPLWDVTFEEEKI